MLYLSSYDTLQNLVDAQNDGLIPVIVFNEMSSCQTGGISGGYSALYDQTINGHTYWYQYMADFATFLQQKGLTSGSSILNFIEMEIQNEPNTPTGNTYQFTHYPNKFGNAAAGLYSTFQSIGYSDAHYFIVTGGVAAPQAQPTNTQGTGCYNNLGVIHTAIRTANTTYGVPFSDLAMGLHPYSYNTNDGYWKNYFAVGNSYVSGGCLDLNAVVNRWKAGWTDGTYTTPSGLPLVISEDNWNAHPSTQNDNSSGTYLIDLFTWLHDHNGYDSPSISPVRLMWYQGADEGTPPLGIYKGGTGTGGSSAIEKILLTPTNPGLPSGIICPSNPYVAGQGHTISNAYYNLRSSACY